MIIGFGKCEEDKELEIESLIRHRISELYAADFDQLESYEPAAIDSLKKSLRSYIDELSAEHKEADAKYKTAESYPERYSTFWGSVLVDVSYVAVILRFGHTNRRHALSPDGWAYLSTSRTFSADLYDVRESIRRCA